MYVGVLPPSYFSNITLCSLYIYRELEQCLFHVIEFIPYEHMLMPNLEFLYEFFGTSCGYI